jgi:hypothetical protein
LVEEAGWVVVALSCKQSLYSPAVLLLNALKGLGSLPGLIVRNPGTSTMLHHVISDPKETGHLAGIHVASHVIAALQQGVADTAVSAAAVTAWLTKLH